MPPERATVAKATPAVQDIEGSAKPAAPATAAKHGAAMKGKAFEIRGSDGSVIKRLTERELGKVSLKSGQRVVMRDLNTGAEEVMASGDDTAPAASKTTQLPASWQKLVR